MCVYLVEQSDVAGRVFVVEEQEAERADTVVERDDDDSLAGCERLHSSSSVELFPIFFGPRKDLHDERHLFEGRENRQIISSPRYFFEISKFLWLIALSEFLYVSS